MRINYGLIFGVQIDQGNQKNNSNICNCNLDFDAMKCEIYEMVSFQLVPLSKAKSYDSVINIFPCEF